MNPDCSASPSHNRTQWQAVPEASDYHGRAKEDSLLDTWRNSELTRSERRRLAEHQRPPRHHSAGESSGSQRAPDPPKDTEPSKLRTGWKQLIPQIRLTSTLLFQERLLQPEEELCVGKKKKRSLSWSKARLGNLLVPSVSSLVWIIQQFFFSRWCVSHAWLLWKVVMRQILL